MSSISVLSDYRMCRFHCAPACYSLQNSQQLILSFVTSYNCLPSEVLCTLRLGSSLVFLFNTFFSEHSFQKIDIFLFSCIFKNIFVYFLLFLNHFLYYEGSVWFCCRMPTQHQKEGEKTILSMECCVRIMALSQVADRAEDLLLDKKKSEYSFLYPHPPGAKLECKLSALLGRGRLPSQ